MTPSEILKNAAFKDSLGYQGSNVRMKKLGFEIVRKDSLLNPKFSDPTYFKNAQGKCINAEIPRKTLQDEVYLDGALSYLHKGTTIPPIKVTKDKEGDLVIIDGNHRAAAAKAQGFTLMRMILI